MNRLSRDLYLLDKDNHLNQEKSNLYLLEKESSLSLESGNKKTDLLIRYFFLYFLPIFGGVVIGMMYGAS